MRRLALCALLVGLFGMATPGFAGSHLWVINEVFSNPDGTIQFVEMKECCGAANETGLNNKWVISMTTGLQYDFTANLPAGTTANAHILLATAGFAALPGAPTPDHIIPDNFFDLNSDLIRFWNYTTSDLTFNAGELPMDGVNSLSSGGIVGQNSPTNFSGQTGTIDVSPPAPEFDRCDVNQDGAFNIADLIALLGVLFSMEPTTCEAALDCNDDNSSNIADAIAGLDNLFSMGTPPPPPFGACGVDPTPGGTLTCMSFAACP